MNTQFLLDEVAKGQREGRVVPFTRRGTNEVVAIVVWLDDAVTIYAGPQAEKFVEVTVKAWEEQTALRVGEVTQDQLALAARSAGGLAPKPESL